MEALQAICNIPHNFVVELVLAEPRVLCLSTTALKAKFEALVTK